MDTQDHSQSEPDVTRLAGDRNDSIERSIEAPESSLDGHREDLSLDVVFDVLKNRRRRAVIRYLCDHGEQVTLGELAEHIAARENDTTVAALTSSQRKRVYVGLYQCHLPKMDGVGLVEFDQDRGRIRLTDRAPSFERYLDASVDGPGPRWHRYYGAISVVGGVGLGAFVLAATPGWFLLPVSVLVVAAAGCCSLLHWSSESDRIRDE